MNRGYAVVALVICALLSGCRTRTRTADVPALPPGPAGAYHDVNPRWSHDGTRIAFLRSTPDRKLQLYLVDDELQRPLALLESELVSPDRPYGCGRDRYSSPNTVSWSADDTQIAFERAEWFTYEDGERLPGTGIWAFNTLSGVAMPLAVHPLHYTSYYYYFHTPEWSPDGRYLAFVGAGINGQSRIFVRALWGQNARAITPRFDAFDDSDWPAWLGRPGNGAVRNVLAFRQGIRREPLTPPTETLRTLSPGSAESSSCRQVVRLAAASWPGISGEEPAPGMKVAPRTVSSAWSADGARIVFAITTAPREMRRYELWVVNADGSGLRRVSPLDGKGYFAPVWIDGHTIGALSPAGGRYEVESIPVDHANAKARSLGVIGSADCDWSPDRREIVWADSATQSQNQDDPTGLKLFFTGVGRRGLRMR